MKPWVKLWRTESTRFKSMPLAARTVASYVLKFVDEGGSLPLGTRDPVTAVALAVSAMPSERRWLRPAVEALMEHGYFAAKDGLLIVGNFPRYQEDAAPVGRRSPSTSTTLVEHSSDVSATVAQHSHDVDTTLARREIRVSARKETLAHSVLSSESEKREIERERERVRALAAQAFQKRWEAVRKAMWPGTKGDPNWDALARFLVETAKLRGTTAEALLATKLDGWFADPYVVRMHHPTENFARYPEKHIDAQAPASGQPPAVPTAQLSPERQELAAAASAVEAARGTDHEHEAVERHRRAKRAVAMAERPVA